MPESGVRTTTLTTSPMTDSILGNRDGSSVQQLVPDLATQMLSSGPLSAALDEKADTSVTDALAAGQTNGLLTAATWSALLAIAPSVDATGAEVQDGDTGTHLAASGTGYNGASVANAGRYSWSQTWGRWVRLSDTGLSGKLTASANLSDVLDVTSARANLGVPAAAALAVEVETSKLTLGPEGEAGRPGILRTTTGGALIVSADGIEHLGFDVDGAARLKLASPAILQLRQSLGIGEVPAQATRILGLGDSLTAGAGAAPGETYLDQLESVTGRATTRLAYGGMTSRQIGALWGSERVHLSVSGGSVPASGGVAVTSDVDILVNGGAYQAGYTARGTIAGISGILSTDVSGNYTFTRATSGSVTGITPANNRFLLDPAGTAFIPGRGAYSDHTVLIGAGRNDPKTSSDERSGIVENIRRMVQAMTPRYRNFFVLSVPNTTAEPAGSDGYNNVMALNADLADAFGPRFIDWRAYLIRYGLYDAGITATAQDLANIADDILPDSFLYDTVHPNADGYAWKARFIASIIR